MPATRATSTSSPPASPKPPTALSGPGATSAARPGPSATKRNKALADLYPERAQLAGSIPPNRSAELADARRLLWLAEQDRRDLRRGTGRWGGTPAGHAAQAASGAALEYQRTSEAVQDKSLGRWGRHKARREVREAGVRLDQALEAWRAVGEPYERPLESNHQRLEADVARLEQGSSTRPVLGPGPLRFRTIGGAGPGRQGARKSSASAICTLFTSTGSNTPSIRATTSDTTGVWGWVSDLASALRPRYSPPSVAGWGNSTRPMAGPPVNQLPLTGELFNSALVALLPRPVNPLTAALRHPWVRAARRHSGFGQLDCLAVMAAVQNPTVRGSRGEGRRPKRSCRLSTSAAHCARKPAADRACLLSPWRSSPWADTGW